MKLINIIGLAALTEAQEFAFASELIIEKAYMKYSGHIFLSDFYFISLPNIG